MTDLKRMRLICGLRQLDVYVATGITPSRISLAERGSIALSQSEEWALRSFLNTRWSDLQALEGNLSPFEDPRSIEPAEVAVSEDGVMG